MGALVLVGLVALSCVLLARALLRRSAGVVLPIAFCLMVAVEGVVLNALSLAHCVTSAALAAAHVSLVAAVLLREAGRAKGGAAGLVTWLRRALAHAWRSPATPPVLPIVATSYFVAIVYPPNNWDSVSYHLSRVVHWMQYGSIGFFPTSDSRENAAGPGAEYLVLLLQSLTGSERFGGAVQTTAFVVLVVGIATMVRYLPASRSLRLALVLLFATVPSFLLEASTEQNDLCASVTALAVMCALRHPLFGATPKLGYRDAAGLGIAVGASYLVKPTSLIFLLPFLGYAAARLVRRTIADRGRELVSGAKAAALALSVCVVVAGPHVFRKAASHEFVAPVEVEVTYPLWKIGSRRLANPLFVFPHHVPSDRFNSWLKRLFDQVSKVDPPHFAREGRIDGFYAGHALIQEEDLAGAPVQFAAIWGFAIVGLSWAAFRRRGARTALALSLFPLAGWVLFHWVARNNVWIARYHDPWFAMAPLSAWGACRWARENALFRKALSAALWPAATIGVAYGWSTLVTSELRPVTTEALKAIDRTRTQYAYVPSLEAQHAKVLEVAAERRCTTLILGYRRDNEFEYPLTWRAHQRGIRVHHFPGPEEGCLLYAPEGFDNPRWRPLGNDLPAIYVRR